MIPDKHQIQVTISTSYKGAKEWFDFLKQKGCDVGLYMVGKKWVVYRSIEETDVFKGYTNHCVNQITEITGHQYVYEGEKYSVSPGGMYERRIQGE